SLIHRGGDTAGARERLSIWVRHYGRDGAAERHGLSGAAAAGGDGVCRIEGGKAWDRGKGGTPAAQKIRINERGQGGAGRSGQAISPSRTDAGATRNQTETITRSIKLCRDQIIASGVFQSRISG